MPPTQYECDWVEVIRRCPRVIFRLPDLASWQPIDYSLSRLVPSAGLQHREENDLWKTSYGASFHSGTPYIQCAALRGEERVQYSF